MASECPAGDRIHYTCTRGSAARPSPQDRCVALLQRRMRGYVPRVYPDAIGVVIPMKGA